MDGSSCVLPPNIEVEGKQKQGAYMHCSWLMYTHTHTHPTHQTLSFFLLTYLHHPDELQAGVSGILKLLSLEAGGPEVMAAHLQVEVCPSGHGHQRVVQSPV